VAGRCCATAVLYKAAMRKLPRWTALGLLACLALSSEAFACSFFFPVMRFEPNAKADAALLRSDPPPPVDVKIGAIERTSSAAACDVYASVDLEFSWSDPSAPKWSDVGFIVRPVLADGFSPDIGKHVQRTRAGDGEPIDAEMVQVVDGKAHLDVIIGDSPPGSALDFDIDVTPMDRAGRLGQTTRVHVHSNARPGERFESDLRLKSRLLAEGDEQGFVWFTHALEAEVKAGTISYEPCGPYAPYGCGATETALLAQGEMPYAQLEWEEPKPWKQACLGVRQSSGRVARVVMIDDGLFTSIAAAEWVQTNGADWIRDAALGCRALMDVAIARETAYLDAGKARYAHFRRLRELREAAEAEETKPPAKSN
jgi:hypothetical protein